MGYLAASPSRGISSVQHTTYIRPRSRTARFVAPGGEAKKQSFESMGKRFQLTCSFACSPTPVRENSSEHPSPGLRSCAATAALL